MALPSLSENVKKVSTHYRQHTLYTQVLIKEYGTFYNFLRILIKNHWINTWERRKTAYKKKKQPHMPDFFCCPFENMSVINPCYVLYALKKLSSKRLFSTSQRSQDPPQSDSLNSFSWQGINTEYIFSTSLQEVAGWLMTRRRMGVNRILPIDWQVSYTPLSIHNRSYFANPPLALGVKNTGSATILHRFFSQFIPIT